MVGFDGEAFANECVSMLGEPDPVAAIAEVVARGVHAPSALEAVFHVPVDPDDDGILYRSPDILVANAMFPAGFKTGLHDHTVPAVIGVWGGHEDNHLYARGGEGLEQVGVARLHPGEVLVLDKDAIHDVHASTRSWSGAIHVYLGDLLNADRHEWAGSTASPVAFDGDAFERSWQQTAARTGFLRER
jgi:predicted metal-dependent enzyme (double-stranded beta helix superfamily)